MIISYYAMPGSWQKRKIEMHSCAMNAGAGQDRLNN